MAYQGGGRTDKAGNKYETNYFIYQLLKVINEEIYSAKLEPSGEDEIGTDILIVNKDETREAQQCKGRNKNNDKWTLSALKQYNILKNWKIQLERDTINSVSLVSPISYILLEDFINMANTSENAKDFYDNHILKDKQYQKFYQEYCEGMELNASNEKDLIKSFDYLKRTYYHQIPDTDLKNIIMEKITDLFCNDKEIVYNALLNFVINKEIWGKTIDLVEIKKYINNNNIKLKNLAFDDKIAPKIDELNKEFDSFFIPINNQMIEREEYKKCKKIINEGGSIIISGKAGYGKSGVVQLIVEECKDNNIPYIAIKLDKRVPENNTIEWGKHLGFPTSISYCLDSISKDRNAVIILDQLDALRWTQANSINALLVCRELINEIENININRKNKISIIFVCRSYDLKYDNNIKSLFKDKENIWNKIQIDKFSEDVVKQVVGKQYENNSKKLNELLEIPSNLFIWTHLDKNKNYDNCYTTNKLIEAWWEQLLNKSIEVKIDNSLISQCINKIVKTMYNMSRISLIKKLVDVDEDALKYLSSNGFLFVEDQTVSFTHQRILDYFLEKEMIRMYGQGKTIEEIVGNKEQQTPSRRYQIQMFLEDLIDLGTREFIEVGEKLLNSNSIRFYIKHVFFEVLGQIENINCEIEMFILKFYNDEKYGKYIINNVIYSNLQYIKILLRNEILDNWIEDENKIDLCINLLKSVSDKYDIEISNFIGRHLFKNEKKDKKIYRCFNFAVISEIDEIFELRMKLYEKYPELSEEYIDFKSLFKSNEMRAIKLIKFWLNYKINNKNKRLYQYEEEFVSEESEIIIEKDEEIINMLLPYVPQEINVDFGEWSGKNKFSLGIERTAVNIIKKANNNLIKRSPEKFWNIYERYMGKGYPIFNELILEGFEKLDNKYSDKIINYLCDDFEKNIFDVSSGNGDKLLTTKKILSKHLKFCKDESFERIENKIYYFYEKDSVLIYKRIRAHNMNYYYNKMPWDWWGNLQVELIPYLPEERISKKTKELYNVLQRKFINGSNYYKYSNGHSGSVWSPIAKKELSDKQWIKLISNEKLRKKENNNWKEVDGGFIESSLEEFAISFINATSKEPKRMIELVLKNSKIILDEFIDALYNGIQSSEKLDDVPINLLEELFEKFPCDDLSNRAQNICWIIERKKDTNWSNKTLKTLRFIAMHHKDPMLGKPNVTSEKDKEIKSIEMLQSNALNCTRGASARAISHLLYNRKELFEEFRETIKNLSQDKNSEVRFASMECLYASFFIDKEWSLPIILKLFEQDDRFLSFWESRRLLFAIYKEENQRNKVLEIIKKLYYSNTKELKKIGALCVSEMYIIYDEFADIMEDVKSMDEIQQEEIIRMIEIYFKEKNYNEKCKKIIINFNKHDCDLENFISRIIYDKDIDLKRDEEFLIEIMKSNSGRRSLYVLIEYIEKNALSILDFAQIILEVAKSFVDEENDKNNIYFYGDELSKLIVGLYDETEGKQELKMKKIANECLDIWDKMFERQIVTIKQLSNEILDV